MQLAEIQTENKMRWLGFSPLTSLDDGLFSKTNCVLAVSIGLR